MSSVFGWTTTKGMLEVVSSTGAVVDNVWGAVLTDGVMDEKLTHCIHYRSCGI